MMQPICDYNNYEAMLLLRYTLIYNIKLQSLSGRLSVPPFLHGSRSSTKFGMDMWVDLGMVQT